MPGRAVRKPAVSDQTIVKYLKQGLGLHRLQKQLGSLEARRVKRLRLEHGIPSKQIIREPVSDETLIALLRQEMGRRRVEQAVGRAIGNKRLGRLRARLGIASRAPKRIDAASLRSLVVQGHGVDKIQQITGVSPGQDRVNRMRAELGISKGARQQGNAAQSIEIRLFEQIRNALPDAMDPVLRDDAISEIYLAVIEGKLSAGRIKAEAKRYANRQVAEWQSRYGPRSLDEVMGDTDLTMLELIEDPSALAAFDRIFEQDPA